MYQLMKLIFLEKDYINFLLHVSGICMAFVLYRSTNISYFEMIFPNNFIFARKKMFLEFS